MILLFSIAFLEFTCIVLFGLESQLYNTLYFFCRTSFNHKPVQLIWTLTQFFTQVGQIFSSWSSSINSFLTNLLSCMHQTSKIMTCKNVMVRRSQIRSKIRKKSHSIFKDLAGRSIFSCRRSVTKARPFESSVASRKA